MNKRARVDDRECDRMIMSGSLSTQRDDEHAKKQGGKLVSTIEMQRMKSLLQMQMISRLKVVLVLTKQVATIKKEVRPTTMLTMSKMK